MKINVNGTKITMSEDLGQRLCNEIDSHYKEMMKVDKLDHEVSVDKFNGETLGIKPIEVYIISRNYTIKNALISSFGVELEFDGGYSVCMSDDVLRLKLAKLSLKK